MADTYTTIQGDMWDSVAYKLYGDELKMTELIAANPQYATTVVFSAGVVLKVPQISALTSVIVPPWKQ
ncbi:MAG: tail protein X [Armatimonadota bacterium]|nr:tail protein X [bacterium]